MNRFVRWLSVFSLLAIASAHVHAADPGTLDHTFGAGFGYVRYADSANIVEDIGHAVAAQADGKIIVAGRVGITPGIVVARFAADGTPDATFGSSGVFRWQHETEVASAHRVVVLPDGKLLVLGYLTTAAKVLLIRLLPDGTLDPTYGSGGIAVVAADGWVTDVRRIVFDDQSRPVIIWEASNPARNEIRVSRLTSQGAIDSDYNLGRAATILDTSGFGEVTTLPFGAAFDPLGRLVIFASAYNAAYNTTLIYRLQRDGFPDALFADNGRIAHRQLNYAFFGHQWTALAASPTSYVLVEWTSDGVQLERFNFDGTIDLGFGANGIAKFVFPGVGSVASGNAVVQADGTIVVTGTHNVSGRNQVFVLAVTPSGAPDPRFGAGAPQVTISGSDIGRPSGAVTAADIATIDGVDLAIGGSIVTAGSSDLLALRLTSTGSRVGVFGGNGAATWDGGDVVTESAQGLWRQPDGKLLTLNRTARGWNWRRFLADGSPDSSFGPGGKRALADEWNGPYTRIVAQGDGRILVARSVPAPAFTNLTRVVRYEADGTRDTAFGTGGAIEFSDPADEDPIRPGIVELSGGKLLIATHAIDGMRLRRLLPNGDIDASFGAALGVPPGPQVIPALNGRPQVGYTLAVQSDGRILVGAATIIIREAPLPQIPVFNDVVARLTADGALDPTYALGNGAVPIQIENARDPQIVRILPLADGKTIVAGNITRRGAQQFFFMRLNTDGSVDTTYGDHTDGADGPGAYIWSQPFKTELRDAMIDAAGRLVIAGAYHTTPEPDDRTTAFVARFLADGTIDGPFGDNALHQPHLFLFDRPEPSGAGNALALTADAIYAAGENGEFGLLLKLVAEGGGTGPATVKSQSVIEFYNVTLDHYFVTADAAEAAAIDSGAAGPGWQRTGWGFRAWTSAGGVPGTATPVCRFYGTPQIGPNSHFYTADPTECDAVKNDPGWRFEGVAFYSVLPTANGCPTGMQPVFRAYNNRFAQNDSNHRLTVSSSQYQAMIGAGWRAEGIVLCSPPN